MTTCQSNDDLLVHSDEVPEEHVEDVEYEADEHAHGRQVGQVGLLGTLREDQEKPKCHKILWFSPVNSH